MWCFFLLLPFLKDAPLTLFFSSKICVPMVWVFLLPLRYSSVWRKQCLSSSSWPPKLLENFNLIWKSSRVSARQVHKCLHESEQSPWGQVLERIFSSHCEKGFSTAILVENPKRGILNAPVKEKLQFCLNEMRDGTVHCTRWKNNIN